MKRIIVSLLVLAALPSGSTAQVAQAGAPRTVAEKIASAIAAAPASITAGAKIMDWPEREGDGFRVLRQGSNGWVCLPDVPFTDGNDPMCLDEPWLAFIQAHIGQKQPAVSRIGFSYMVAPGGAWGSNTDPYATSRTSDNEWALHGPHIMMIVPDPKMLEGLPTKHDNGGPWVMWAGTPYAHVMIPVSAHR